MYTRYETSNFFLGGDPDPVNPEHTVAKWIEHPTLVNMVWGSNPPGSDNSQHDAGKFGYLLWVRYKFHPNISPYSHCSINFGYIGTFPPKFDVLDFPISDTKKPRNSSNVGCFHTVKVPWYIWQKYYFFSKKPTIDCHWLPSRVETFIDFLKKMWNGILTLLWCQNMKKMYSTL